MISWKPRRARQLGSDWARRWVRHGEGPQPKRTKILVETPDAAEAWAMWLLLRDNGYDMSWCPGPEGPPVHECPLVSGGSCPLVDDADAVVSMLGLESTRCREVVGALGEKKAQPPVVVEAPLQSLLQWKPILKGMQLLRSPMTSKRLLDVLEVALMERAYSPR